MTLTKMQAANDTCIKKKLYFESKSAVRWKLQASIDEVSRYIGEDSSLRNTTTTLKILKRKFMKEKEEPLIPASIKHLSFDEIKSLWAWDDIYQSLRRGHNPDEILEDHPYAVFLEFEKKLLSFHEVNPVELNELATKLHTWSQVPEWSPALGNLTIRTKPHPQCITTNFLSNFGIYGSEAELLIQLTLPRSVSAAWTSMSLYFNHPKYHSERIDV